MFVKINEIILDHRFQPRFLMDDDIIAEYAESMSNGAQFPAMVLYDIDDKYYLVDGWHRYQAYVKIGAEKVKVDATEGTFEDALCYALGANHSNGLRRTNDDKRKAVKNALGMFPEWSDVRIAEVCKVTSQFVCQQRNLSVQSENNSDVEEEAKPKIRVCKDGRKMNTENIGKKQTKKKPLSVQPVEPNESYVVSNYKACLDQYTWDEMKELYDLMCGWWESNKGGDE